MEFMKNVGAITSKELVSQTSVALSAPASERRIDPSKIRVPSRSIVAVSKVTPSVESSPTARFLERLWPGKGHQFIVTQDPRSSAFHTHPVANAQIAAGFVSEWSVKGLNVFHACSAYATVRQRTKENVSSVKAFWLDIDCGANKAETGKGYATQTEALAALNTFCAAASLPLPNYEINSGYGAHAYWILDKAIGLLLWQEFAGLFKKLTLALGLKADPSRTADAASLMRTPGGMNHKGETPIPVTVIRSDDADIPVQSLLDAINAAFEQHCGKVGASKSQASPMAEANDGQFSQDDFDRLKSALTVLDPDCDDYTWKFHRLAVLARLAVEHPDWADRLYTLARFWSSGELRGKAAIAWTTPGNCNRLTGEQAFDQTWNRFINNNYAGKQATVGTIYYHAKAAGWRCLGVTAHLLTADKFAKEDVSPVDSAIEVIPAKVSKLSPLESIQHKFCLVKTDSKFWVFDLGNLHAQGENGLALKPEFFNQKDGSLLLQRALIASGDTEGDAARNARKFFTSPQTTCYDSVEFNPCGSRQNKLNLWIGPTLVPEAGSWALIRSFLLEVICDNDQAAFDYLIRFIAHALQFPEDKPGIMVILLGGQGVGKGTLAKILRRIWSATYYHIHKIEDVTGNFNATLERAFIVFLDEALFVGDRKASDSLKSLVTENVIQINEKYQPARQTRSYHRFFAATNADHFKNTERDDRRDFVLRVSEARKGDHDYWSALNVEIEGAGVAAMMDDLLKMDLSSFNVRSKPTTVALTEQKIHSLGLIERWWFNVLMTGDAGVSEVPEWSDFISTKAIIEDSVELSGGRIHRKPSDVEAVATMKKLCPSVRNGQRQDSLERRRGLYLPDIQTARQAFEHYIGGPVSWDDV